MTKIHGNTGNKNAKKENDGKALVHIHARCTLNDKEAWTKAANSKGMKLTEWIIKTLNANC